MVVGVVVVVVGVVVVVVGAAAAAASSAPPKLPQHQQTPRRVHDRSKSGAQEIVNDMSFTLEINQKAGDLVAPCTKR